MMKLLDCYLPVFKLAAHFVLEPDHYDNYDNFRQQCISCLEKAVVDAEHHDVSDFERDQALFATVVWLDETVLCSPQSFAHFWRSELLQRKYFQTVIGGEAFFTRLNLLKEEHHQARLVFLFCLHNGFHGMYGTDQERTTLSSLIEKQRQLCLPQDWQPWPNEAEITPVTIKRRSLASSSKNQVVLTVLGIALIYASLVLFQTLYFS